jgi:hypothetical protein
MSKTVPCLLALLLFSSGATAERPPFFEGTVIFKGGETRLDLTDDTKAVSIPLPSIFAGWGCYVADTQRSGPAYVKKITCGGKWGFVDTFATCSTKSREGMALLRLRQPVVGSKQDADAAEKVTISVGCGYAR